MTSSTRPSSTGWLTERSTYSGTRPAYRSTGKLSSGDLMSSGYDAPDPGLPARRTDVQFVVRELYRGFSALSGATAANKVKGLGRRTDNLCLTR